TESELQAAVKEELVTTDDRTNISKERLTNFVFVGTLTSRKRPLYAINLVKELSKKGYNVRLSFVGEGEERTQIEEYITENQLTHIISLEGNKSKEEVAKIF